MITKEIIDNRFIVNNITSIIPSTILLDFDLNILAISNEIGNLINFSEAEVCNQNVFEALSCYDDRLVQEFESFKQNGFFKSKNYVVSDKYKRPVEVEISGFCMGIFSDFSDFILLGIRNINEQKTYQRLLENKACDFNELVYRTYHDLRGPTATIEGLINISDYSNNLDEHKNLLDLIKQSNNTLNERISKFSQIFEHNYERLNNCDHCKPGHVIEYVENLAKEQLNGKEVNVTINKFDITNKTFGLELLQKALRYAVLAFLSYHKSLGEKVGIDIDLESDANNLVLSFDFSGFSGPTDYFVQALEAKNGFSDIMQNSNAINFYLLQDLFLKHKGIFIPLFNDSGCKRFKIALEF